jgi:hypothetical protein
MVRGFVEAASRFEVRVTEGAFAVIFGKGGGGIARGFAGDALDVLPPRVAAAAGRRSGTGLWVGVASAGRGGIDVVAVDGVF